MHATALVCCLALPSSARDRVPGFDSHPRLLTWLSLRCIMLSDLCPANGYADGQSEPAALAACAARRWLARTAADVHSIRNGKSVAPSALTSLVSCLPALQRVDLWLPEVLNSDDLRCLLEALARCPGLKALKFSMGFDDCEDEEDEEWWGEWWEEEEDQEDGTES